MDSFLYQGIDREGRTVRGTMAAKDELSLEEQLKGIGLWLVEAKTIPQDTAPKRKSGNRWSFFGGIARRELIDFCTLMSFQLRVGIPLLQALEVASSDCPNPQFSGTLIEVRRLVESGETLHQALARFPRVFSAQFLSLIRAGESSSALPESFLELKRYLEWQEQILADIRQATIYPVVVLIVVGLFVLTLFTFVIPRFVLLLTVAKVELPLITRVMFGLSDFAKATWWLWLIALIVVPLAIQTARRYSLGFALAFDRAKFKMPIFGELNHMLVIARLAHNLAVLYSSGINIIQSLKLCEGLVGSTLVAQALADVGERLGAGELVSEALRHHDVFPVLLVRMVAMGERTGTLDESLENVAGYYNVVIPRRIKKVFSILEPALILFLVGIVGLVALSVFLPIISLMTAIR